MTSDEIKKILHESKFQSENDRNYWIERLKETERKEKITKENEKYFIAMRKYNR